MAGVLGNSGVGSVVQARQLPDRLTAWVCSEELLEVRNATCCLYLRFCHFWCCTTVGMGIFWRNTGTKTGFAKLFIKHRLRRVSQGGVIDSIPHYTIIKY